eukprot:1140231-Pelagomonas_calceolata.AAC.1
MAPCSRKCRRISGGSKGALRYCVCADPRSIRTEKEAPGASGFSAVPTGCANAQDRQFCYDLCDTLSVHALLSLFIHANLIMVLDCTVHFVKCYN